ncbi:MAG: hypothetical protein R3325_02615 [Thermoanaerobaculia bacterium]|nr:hypothetical protein [Thermoanaerobaculia bacterium]
MKPSPRVASRLALSIVSLVASLAVAELVVRGLDLFPEERLLTRELSGLPERTGLQKRTTVHPYLGWARQPGIVSGRLRRADTGFPGGVPSPWALENSRANLFGLNSAIADYRTVAATDLVIAVFGGSVANDVVWMAGDHLAAQVTARHPSAAGSVVVLNFGNGGYKQPQQLIALGLATVLGIPLDVVVNLDGFNEVVFGPLNAASGAHPIFPAMGQYAAAVQLQTGLLSDEAVLQAAAVLRQRRAAERKIEALGGSGGFGASELARAVVGRLAQHHLRRAVQLEEELQTMSRQAKNPGLASLTASCIEEGRPCLRLTADLWQRSSELMNALAASVGARYLHLLQPNQYVPQSKPLAAEELERAWAPGSYYGKHAASGYELLRERGARLRRRGVDFHDLTLLFAEIRDPIYVDPCCHYNMDGQTRLARAIGDLVADALTAAPAPAGGGIP